MILSRRHVDLRIFSNPVPPPILSTYLSGMFQQASVSGYFPTSLSVVSDLLPTCFTGWSWFYFTVSCLTSSSIPWIRSLSNFSNSWNCLCCLTWGELTTLGGLDAATDRFPWSVYLINKIHPEAWVFFILLYLAAEHWFLQVSPSAHLLCILSAIIYWVVNGVATVCRKIC